METTDTAGRVITTGDVVRIGRHLVQVEDTDPDRQRLKVKGKWVAARAVVWHHSKEKQDAIDRAHWARIERANTRMIRRIVRLIERGDF